MANKCYLDTTYLANCLFLSRSESRQYKSVLAQFSEVNVSEYAHKELKLGVIRNFTWLHDKLIDAGTTTGALAVLNRSALSPRRYRTATAIQALKVALDKSLKQLSVGGSTAKVKDPDSTLARLLSLEIKRLICSGWNNRLSVGKLVFPLPCYQRNRIDPNSEPFSIEPSDCTKGVECCLVNALKSRGDDIKSMRQIISNLQEKAEYKRRNDALKLVQLGRSMGPTDCRKLGDAYFLLTCRHDWELLTSNTKDFEPFEKLLKLTVSHPVKP